MIYCADDKQFRINCDSCVKIAIDRSSYNHHIIKLILIISIKDSD